MSFNDSFHLIIHDINDILSLHDPCHSMSHGCHSIRRTYFTYTINSPCLMYCESLSPKLELFFVIITMIISIIIVIVMVTIITTIITIITIIITIITITINTITITTLLHALLHRRAPCPLTPSSWYGNAVQKATATATATWYAPVPDQVQHYVTFFSPSSMTNTSIPWMSWTNLPRVREDNLSPNP